MLLIHITSMLALDPALNGCVQLSSAAFSLRSEPLSTSKLCGRKQ